MMVCFTPWCVKNFPVWNIIFLKMYYYYNKHSFISLPVELRWDEQLDIEHSNNRNWNWSSFGRFVYVCKGPAVCKFLQALQDRVALTGKIALYILKKMSYREYYTSTRWRRFILQRVVSKTYLTSESELDKFGNHEL